MKIGDKVKASLPPIAPSMYPAICVGVIDIGEQYSEFYKKYSDRVVFAWDIPSLTVEIDGEQKPRQISKTVTFTASKKGALRKLLSGWNGVQYTDEQFKALDLFAQIGRPCCINVVLSDDGKYSNVDTVTPLVAGLPAPRTATPPFKWDMDEWNDAAFDALPEWARERIKKSTQYQKAHPPANAVDFPERPAPQSPEVLERLETLDAKLNGKSAQSAAQGVADCDRFFYHPESETYWMICKGEALHGEIETSREINREVFAWGIQTGQEPSEFKESSRPAASEAGIPATPPAPQAAQAGEQASATEDDDEGIPF